jgi:alkyldihydroxyacetonephosphate synthase
MKKDREQFEFGAVLKPAGAWYAGAAEILKKTYLTRIKGFDLQKMAAATLLFEGEEEDIKRQETLIIEIAKKYGGFSAGATNGMKGYILTFVIAYIRVSIGINNLKK